MQSVQIQDWLCDKDEIETGFSHQHCFIYLFIYLCSSPKWSINLVHSLRCQSHSTYGKDVCPQQIPLLAAIAGTSAAVESLVLGSLQVGSSPRSSLVVPLLRVWHLSLHMLVFNQLFSMDCWKFLPHISESQMNSRNCNFSFPKSSVEVKYLRKCVLWNHRCI